MPDNFPQKVGLESKVAGDAGLGKWVAGLGSRVEHKGTKVGKWRCRV